MFSKSSLTALFLAAYCLSDASAFAPASSSLRTTTSLNAYVPDGLTAEQYNKLKQQEATKNQGKNLGALGPRGFKSRSMEAWQQAYEKGLAGHSFAPFGYREQLKKGELKKSDVPYMVRGGSWDNSDVSGSKKLTWMKADKEYARGGYKKQQSASILGGGPGFDWAGTRPRDVNLLNGSVPGLS
ncbi:MAG: hypothetical protein SGILL_010613 [Bacillariaceae sp.]